MFFAYFFTLKNILRILSSGYYIVSCIIVHHPPSAAHSLLRRAQLFHPSSKPKWDKMSFLSYQGEPVWGVQTSTFQETLALALSHDHADYWVTSLRIIIPHESKVIISYIPRNAVFIFLLQRLDIKFYWSNL